MVYCRNPIPITLATLTTTLFVASVAHAHDIWLFPDQFHVARGQTITVRQFSGIELEDGEEVPLYRLSTPRFELLTATERIDLLRGLPDVRTQPTVMPVLERPIDFDGMALASMSHAFTHTFFPADDFRAYLEHEQYSVADFREYLSSVGERERYLRTLKTLVQSGDSTRGDAFRRVVGQRIEIVLLQNPYELDLGDELHARVLFEGQPLRDRTVMAFSRARPDGEVTKTTVRTDAGGVAVFTLDRTGIWLLRLVHLRRCEEPEMDTCDGASWESFWTSYTFAVD